jgi:hypothetical protein
MGSLAPVALRRERQPASGADVSSLDEQTVTIRWEPDLLEQLPDTTPVAFITPCPEPVLMQRDGLVWSLQEFVESVCRRLAERAPESNRTRLLLEAWRQANDQSSPDYGAQLIAARMGARWSELQAAQRDHLRQAAELGRAGLEVVAAAPSLDELPETLAFAHAVMKRTESAAAAPKWRDQVLAMHAAPIRSLKPWVMGWKAAEALRRALHLPSDHLGFSPDAVGLVLEDGGRAPLACDSVISWSSGRAPIRWLGKDRPSDNGFARLRDIYAPLFDGPLSGLHVRTFSANFTGIRPIANAFAAELFAPIAAIRPLLPRNRRITSDDLTEIAERLGAPYKCVEHQVENRRDLRQR